MSINLEKTRVLYETGDYTQFVFQEGNREISQAHVRQIRQSMRIHGNLLDLYPITVSRTRAKGGKDLLVIHDGQHRFEAARSLGHTLFYVVDDDNRLTIQTVIDTNAAQKSWTYRDYLSSYCVRDFKEYLRVREFITLYPMPLMPSLQLLCGGDATIWRNDFKRGRFRVLEWDYACAVADACRDFAQFFGAAFQSHFISAVSMLMRNPHYDHAHMQGKIPQGVHLLCGSPSSSVDDFFQTLVQLYNYKTHGRNVVEFDQIDSKGRIRRAGRWITVEHPENGTTP